MHHRRDAFLVERKRNEIQIWERAYERAHERKPTRKDVEENESVRKMYREYKELVTSMTSKCTTKSIQNKNNDNGKGGDFENVHPTAKKEECESDGEDEVIEATPPRKQRHVKQQQHNKSSSFSKSSSLPPSSVVSMQRRRKTPRSRRGRSFSFRQKEEAKRKRNLH